MIEKFWRDCLRAAGKPENTQYKGTICFGITAVEAQEAIEQIIAGNKRASIYPCSGYRCAMKGEPECGQLNVVVDWNDVPHIAIETVSVQKTTLRELTDEICALCAENMTLESWREGFLPAIKKELEELGEELSDGTGFIIEEFRAIYSA